MIAAFDDVKKIRGRHLAPDLFQEFERTKRVAGSLHEQDRRPQFAQYLVAEFGRIPAAAERITEANQTGHRFFEREMAPDAAAHAFTDQDRRLTGVLSRVSEGVAMSGDEQGEGIGAPTILSHVIIIKSHYIPNRGEPFLPGLHPPMRGRRAGARSEKKKRPAHRA